MFKSIIIFSIMFMGFLAIAACDDGSTTTPAKPDKKIPESDNSQEPETNTPTQIGPAQNPACQSTDIAYLVPDFWWYSFKYTNHDAGVTWTWTRELEHNGESLLTWLGEDQDRLYIVVDLAKKRFLQQQWPWFSDQIKTLNDLHPNLPIRNYEYVAIESNWFLATTAPSWFYNLYVELSKQ